MQAAQPRDKDLFAFFKFCKEKKLDVQQLDLSPEMLEKAEKIMQVFDVNHDGVINKKDFELIAEQIKSPEMIITLFRGIASVLSFAQSLNHDKTKFKAAAHQFVYIVILNFLSQKINVSSAENIVTSVNFVAVRFEELEKFVESVYGYLKKSCFACGACKPRATQSPQNQKKNALGSVSEDSKLVIKQMVQNFVARANSFSV